MHAQGLYEGTLWQYRWHVPFDIEGLVELTGGVDSFTNQLDYFFDNQLYNHGNQPDLHVPYLYMYSSKPKKADSLIQHILTKESYQWYGTHHKWKKLYVGKIYSATPKGYIPEMDDDDGTMASWYVQSSLGLYPLETGKGTYHIIEPIFDEIKIDVGDGNYFSIEKKTSAISSEKGIFFNRKSVSSKSLNY